MAMSRHDRLAAVHAAFACLAVLILLPIAVLIAHFKRGGTQWIRIHRLVNTAVALLIVVSFGLGVASMDGKLTQLSGDDIDVHHQLGLGIFVLILLQVVMGFVAHRMRGPQSDRSAEGQHSAAEKAKAQDAKLRMQPARRHWLRWLHIFVGILLTVMLYAQTWQGLHVEWHSMSDSGSYTPAAVEVIFWILVGVPVAAYVVDVARGVLGSMATYEGTWAMPAYALDEPEGAAQKS
ncbi:unnamed protein product [Parajaminaea phylloscopi]